VNGSSWRLQLCIIMFGSASSILHRSNTNYDSFASEYRTVVVIKPATDAAVKALNFCVRIAPIFWGLPLVNIWWYDDRILKIHINRIWKLNCLKLIVFHHLKGSYYKQIRDF